MRNSAWRPARLQTERLAGIQHHFLDGRPASASTGHAPVKHTLPICMAVTPGHPGHALQPHTLVDALTGELNKQTVAVARLADWRVQVIPPQHVVAPAAAGFMLVFATADLEGVRLAYSVIKQLASGSIPHCGVLFSGAGDAQHAQRCQQRLASGVHRFLGIRLRELGHIAGPGPEFSADLPRLATAVRRLCENHSIPDPAEVAYT
jgi:hypothetical protein